MRIDPVEDIDGLRRVSALFAAVWGHSDEGVPISSEMLKCLVQAGGLVSVAYADAGRLIGAAVLGRAEPKACYGYIAAVAPGMADRGIGFALKQHQRAWALEHGVREISWTFDPLVSRNARFNLTKLGARTWEYLPAFYGRMADDLNGDDPADRVLARWRLGSAAVARAAAGRAQPVAEPPADALGEAGPDGRPATAATVRDCWIRVPSDIVELRRSAPETASEWRAACRTWLRGAFADGWVADGVTPSGWYHLSRPPS